MTTIAKYLLLAGAIALAAAAFFYPTAPKQQPPSERTHAMVPSPPTSSDPSISLRQIEEHELSLDKIAGLSGEQTVGLLSRMNPTERAELGRRLTALAPGSLNNEKVAMFFRAWAKFDARAAFQMALNFRTVSQKWGALVSVLEGADAKDVASLVDSLTNLAPGTISAEIAQGLLQTGLSKWASVDGAAAASWLDRYGRDANLSAWQAVAQSWGAVDPKGALAWINEQPNATIKDKQMEGVMMAWVKHDVKAAAEYARAHFDGTLERAKYVALAANYLAGDDPQAALAYVQTLPDSARRFAQATTATKWAYNDPAAAAAWVSSLPAADQAEASVGVIAMWATQDPQAAGNWINTLQGGARDSAASAYSYNLAPRDPATALGWAQSIASDSIRTSTVDAVVTGWLQRDRASATEWINNSQLPDEEKTRLLSPRG